jgi:hypothetical protein
MRRGLGLRSSSDAPGFGVPVHGTRHAIGSKPEQFYHVLATCWASFMLAGTPYRATDHDLLLGRECACVCGALAQVWRSGVACVSVRGDDGGRLHLSCGYRECCTPLPAKGPGIRIGGTPTACRCQRRGQAFAGGGLQKWACRMPQGVGRRESPIDMDLPHGPFRSWLIARADILHIPCVSRAFRELCPAMQLTAMWQR